MRIGEQITEVILRHRVATSAAEADDMMHELLHQVRIPDPKRSAAKFPHQMSGGQQQRVSIAMAVACSPQLVILDEPTTGLDVTTQSHILDLLAQLREDLHIAFAYVTHDLSVVAAICDRVGVMYAGELIEEAPTSRLFLSPRHPYTHGLIAAVPRLNAPRRRRAILRGMLQRNEMPQGCKFSPRCDFATETCRATPQVLQPCADNHCVACWRSAELPFAHCRDEYATILADEGFPPVLPMREWENVLLEVNNLSCVYEWTWDWRTLKRRPVPVVRGVSFAIKRGETIALVGESGSGKSTLAKTVAGLLPRAGGALRFDSQPIPLKLHQRDKAMLQRIRLILQNPDASLNPRHRVVDIVGRPLEVFFALSGNALRKRVRTLLRAVRLDDTYLSRYPYQLSGGERQRVAIACALAGEPDLLVCDEVLSALDVSVQAEVVELLRTLQAERHMAYLFISHDLAVVRSLADRVGVMYRGELVEFGSVEEVYTPPYHPYTHVLLSSVPSFDTASRRTARERSVSLVASRLPEVATITSACPFAAKCPWKIGAVCDEVPPLSQQVSETHFLRCHLPLTELIAREGSLWTAELPVAASAHTDETNPANANAT
jgi:peptide/nickel transport system ATP-binding protein